MTITNDLNWKQHVENITKSANKALGFLRRNLRINSVKAYRTSISNLCPPNIRILEWDPYRIYQERQLEMVQRLATSFVCNRYRQTSSVNLPTLMAGLDWEPLINNRRRAISYSSQAYYPPTQGLTNMPSHSSQVLLDCGINYQPLQHRHHH